MLKKVKYRYIVFILLLSILSILKFYRDSKYIIGNMPYPQHVDEYHIVINGINMINNQNFYPGILCYPSLPIYFNASIIYVSHFLDRLTNKSKVDKLDNQSYPFYKEYKVILFAKISTYLLSFLTTFGLCFIVLKLTNCYASSITCFILVSFSQLFLYHSRDYINIDLFASFFVTLNILFFLYFFQSNSSYRNLIIAGILTGFTISSKYPHGLIILIYFSFILFARGHLLQKIINCFVILLVSIVTTLICCPYIVIFFDKWFIEVVNQRQIYNDGWPGFTVEPGIQNLFIQINQIFNEFGPIIFLSFLCGLFFLLKYQKKFSIPVLIYFFVFLLYFSNHSVNLVRNLLPHYNFYPVIASIGFFQLLRYFKKFAPSSVIIFIFAILTCISFPSSRALRIISADKETRNQLTDYINTSLPKGCNIFISSEVGLDTSKLVDFSVTEINFLNDDRKSLNLLVTEIANKDDFFIYPTFSNDMRWPDGDHYAQKINKSLHSTCLLLHLEGRVGGSFNLMNLSRPGIQVNSHPASPWGNPSIIVSKGLDVFL